MSYRETARQFDAAEMGAYPNRGFPLPRFADRADLGPQSIAEMHAEHVESAAYALREALAWYADDSESGGGIVVGGLAVADAARALLAAIGEGEGA